MIFTFTDVWKILEISIVLFASAFALYLPLIIFVRTGRNTLKCVIPVSISVQIIFAYVFYCFAAVKYYPPVYFGIILALNIFAVIKLRVWQKGFKFIQPKPLGLFITLALVSVLVYSRFYDSLMFVAPGTIDTFNHLTFLKDLKTIGFLSNSYYAPGFHLFIYPLTYLVDFAGIYRFSGGVVGLIFVLSVYLAFKDTFKNLVSVILLLLILTFPFLNDFILATIGFYSTSLSFILFVGFLYPLFSLDELGGKKVFLLYLTVSLALAVTVPYLLVQFIPALAFLSLVVLITKKSLVAKSKKLFLIFIAISVLGFIVSFAHVYLQTKALHVSNSFPELLISDPKTEKVSTNLNKPVTGGIESADRSAPRHGAFYNSYISPMILTAKDVLSVKNIRPINNFLSAGAYAWTLLSILLIFYSIRKNKKQLLVISALSIIFGFAILTGVFEMTFYRGRSGWYLMFLAAVGIAYMFDEIYQKRDIFWGLVFVILAFFAIMRPPHYYRAYFPEIFTEAYKISKAAGAERVTVITRYYQLAMISKNLDILPFEEKSLSAEGDKKFLIMEKKYFRVDPVLSQQALSIDRVLKNFNEKQKGYEGNFNEQIKTITSSEKFSNFEKYWENDNILIYRQKGQI